MWWFIGTLIIIPILEILLFGLKIYLIGSLVSFAVIMILYHSSSEIKIVDWFDYASAFCISLYSWLALLCIGLFAYISRGE